MKTGNLTSLRLLAAALSLAFLAGSSSANTKVFQFSGTMGVGVNWAWGLSPTRIQCESLAPNGVYVDDAEAVVADLVAGINALGISGVYATVLTDPKTFSLEMPSTMGLYLGEACPTQLSCEPQPNEMTNCMYGMEVQEVTAADIEEKLRLGIDPLRNRRTRPDSVRMP